jgi:multidrug efflux pump subunit AcrB
MLPFDNKSEFQIVVDMPTGTALEQTAGVLHDIGAYIATVPKVTDYQGYAGTAAPINFNGLVRQYYLRSEAEQGDLQVNLQDKHHRSRSSHEIAFSVREPVEKIAKAWGAKVKIVEVPPGPPVLSPIVAEIYGPDYDGARRVATRVHEQFSATPDIVGIDDTVSEVAPKMILRVMQSKAALLGWRSATSWMRCRSPCPGRMQPRCTTAMRNTRRRCACVWQAAERSRIDDVLKLKVCPRRCTGAAVGSGASGADAARLPDLPQGPAAGGVRDRRHGRQAG